MKARPQNAIPELTAIGADIGKDIFHIVDFGADGKIALRRKIKRLALAETFKIYLPASSVWRRASAPVLSAERCGRSDTNRGSSRQFTSSHS
jgi:hypothetical protein